MRGREWWWVKEVAVVTLVRARVHALRVSVQT